LGTTVLKLLCEKVRETLPEATVDGEVRAKTGVLAVAEVKTELKVPPVGVVRLTLKTSPEFEEGRATTNAEGVAEKIVG